MATDPSANTAALADQLIQHIRRLNRCAVAFSGGVDSAVVAMAAHQALGDHAEAITAVSPSLAAADRTFAAREAAHIGIRHREIQTAELQSADYRRNSGDRCFHCRDTMYATMELLLQHTSDIQILNGANHDDLGDHRPGMKAALQHRVGSPLLELKISKSHVRQLANFWNLLSADRPASPCLASRIVYGIEVTPERLSRIEQAEGFLRTVLGNSNFRVRLESGELARIEVEPAALPLLCEETMRNQITVQLRRLGFRAVTLDLEGFRSGNLNQLLIPLGDLTHQSGETPDEY